MVFRIGHIQYNSGRTHFKKGHVPWHKDKKLSLSHKKKLSESHKGQKPWNTGIKGIHLSPQTEFKKGENIGIKNGQWKGDNVGYDALHDWVKRKLGKAFYCSKNKNHKGKFEWSNKSYLYKRDLNDWESLCHKCHFARDKGKNWGKVKYIFKG